MHFKIEKISSSKIKLPEKFTLLGYFEELCAERLPANSLPIKAVEITPPPLIYMS